jgi:hypothetical protein
MNKETILNKLRKKYPIEDEVSFHEFNIKEKLQEQTKLLMKYWDLHQKSLFLKDKYLNEMIDKKMEVYDRLRFENDRNLTKTEIENFYLPADKEIKKIQAKIDTQQLVVEYFKLCYDSVKQLQWNIKTFLQDKDL